MKWFLGGWKCRCIEPRYKFYYHISDNARPNIHYGSRYWSRLTRQYTVHKRKNFRITRKCWCLACGPSYSLIDRIVENRPDFLGFCSAICWARHHLKKLLPWNIFQRSTIKDFVNAFRLVRQVIAALIQWQRERALDQITVLPGC